MGIRQTLNENPIITTAGAAGIILIAIIFIIWQGCGGSTPAGSAPPTKMWFTTDDGNTRFVDEINKLPPFTHSDGKVAVRAKVFKCGDGEPFVNHLEKYNDADKKV